MAITHYFYNGQLRDYILQFVNIFSGLQVQTGKGECDVPEFITVTTVVGTKDRVVAALMSGNTQNRTFSLPTMAVHLQGLELAPDRRRSPGWVDQRVALPVEGVFPDDLVTVKKVMPVPYTALMELSIYASNTQQLHQILEQILVLFNPALQIQKSDGPHDWTKLTSVELTGISNEENYPSGPDRRIISWTLTFQVPIWLSIPIGLKDDLVRRIIIKIADSSGAIVHEVDADGNLTPFGTPIAEITVEQEDKEPSGPIPFAPREIL
jgi:hypothetical protein